MARDFGKLNFAVGFNRTSAFPLDANSYFESYDDAVAAAAGAAVVGSSDSAYYIGQLIIVNESGKFGLYQIGADRTLVKFGQASSADDLKSQLDALAETVEGLKTSKAGWEGDKAPTSANGQLITVDNTGKIKASGFTIVNSGVSDSATQVPTSKAVQTYVASQVASAVQYLGTVSALTGLSQTAGKGDFYRLSAAVNGGHAGDLVIAEKDNPAQLIDGINWSLIHGEEVGVEAINAGDGIKVITTGEGSSEAQPTIAMKPATTSTIGGIIVGTNLTIDATGKLSAKDTTYDDVTTTTHGLMTVADKVKLDGIETGANKTTVDAAFTANSTNPVQSKIIQAEFAQVRTELAGTETNLENKINNKVDKVEGKELSSNDYTDEEKTKLAGLSNYTLPVASTGALGGIKVGYDGTTEKTYAVKLDTNNKAYVEVPWKNTTYTNGNGLTLTGTSFSLNVASSTMHGGIKAKAGDPVNSIEYPNNSDHEYGILVDGSGTAFIRVPWTDTKYTLPTASTTALGGVKSTVTGTTADRNYNVEVNSDGTMKVNVPWTDTKYTLPTASTTALGGVKIGSGITITNGVISLTDKSKYDGYETNKLDKSALTVSATAGVTLNDTTYKYTLPTATDTVLGGIKFNKRYIFDKELTPAEASVVQASSQLYPLVCDQSGIPFVYVPWTDTKYTLTQADADNLGGIKIGYTTSDRNFAVQLDSDGKAYVAVPASAEYSLPTATENTLGGIKAKQSDGANDIQYIMNKKSYGVMVNASGHAWVGIPDTISTDKITQGTNTLIINGGGANW